MPGRAANGVRTRERGTPTRRRSRRTDRPSRGSRPPFRARPGQNEKEGSRMDAELGSVRRPAGCGRRPQRPERSERTDLPAHNAERPSLRSCWPLPWVGSGDHRVAGGGGAFRPRPRVAPRPRSAAARRCAHRIRRRPIRTSTPAGTGRATSHAPTRAATARRTPLVPGSRSGGCRGAGWACTIRATARGSGSGTRSPTTSGPTATSTGRSTARPRRGSCWMDGPG